MVSLLRVSHVQGAFRCPKMTLVAGEHKEEGHAAVVLKYLQKMGFRQTERLFKEEAHAAGVETLAFELRNEQDSSISNYLLFPQNAQQAGAANGGVPPAAAGPAGTPSAGLDHTAYGGAYEGLRRWIHNSLDAFRDEFMPILYPIAVHCILDMVSKGALSDARAFIAKFGSDHELEHGDELLRISSLTDASQVKENSLATAFRSTKYNVSMSAYSFQLLMGFLQDSSLIADSGNVLLLKIINQFINIRVLVNRPLPRALGAGSSGNVRDLGEDGPVTGLVGKFPGKHAAAGDKGASTSGAAGGSAKGAANDDDISFVNKEKISWGVHAVDPAVEAALHSRSKIESRLNEVLHGPLAHLKRSLLYSSLAAPQQSAGAGSKGAVAIPHPPPTAAETNAEIDRLRNLARRAALSSSGLPSICFYTLQNTRGHVTSVEFSPMSTLMATGNAESFIDVWSLNHEPLRALRASTDLASIDLTDFDSLEPMREAEGSLTKRLIGHCGPVYATRFLNPDGDRFLISVSQDASARLWSLDTFTCVAIYKSHTYPIWDVDVAPLGAGPYFVTASADRTARLWSTDRSQPLRVFAGHLSDVECVRFHPNANYIVTGSADKTIRMWDIQSGGCVRIFTGHTRAISALKISPDGRILVSADRSGLVKAWDIAEGRLIRNCRASKGTSEAPLHPAMTLAAHGSFSAGGSGNGSGANSEIHAVGKGSPIYTLDFDRDGRILATGGADQVVRLWDFGKITSASSAPGVNLALLAPIEEHLGLLASYPTKSTPIQKVQFTYRNVLLASGPFTPDA